jgi:DNA-binding MarR family transcriptional regulator
MPSYLIFPRKLLKLGLTVTELSVYMLLLDRARLSCQNEGWQDEEGNTFLLFPVRALAEALDSSETAVKKAMRKLEGKGLITRQRQGMCRPNRIYVKVPEADEAPSAGESKAGSPPGSEAASPEVNEAVSPEVNKAASPVGRKTASPRARKLPPNKNYREKTTELKGGSKYAFGTLQNLTLTADEALEVFSLPEGEAHADKVALYLAGGWKFPYPMDAIRTLARGVPIEDMLLQWPYTKQSPEPSPEPPPSYP